MRSAADIEADLTVAYASRRAAMQVASYNAGDVSKTNQTLKELTQVIRDLTDEMNLVNVASGSGGGIFAAGVVLP
jgi:hypothetical protein